MTSLLGFSSVYTVVTVLYYIADLAFNLQLYISYTIVILFSSFID